MPKRIATAMRAALVAASLCALTAPALKAQDAAAGAAGTAPVTVKHTVKAGDTLWDLARYYLKDPHKWPEVFHANTDIVKDPHWIYPGQVLTIDAAAVKPEVLARETSPGIVVEQIQTRAQEQTVFADHAVMAHSELGDATRLPPALTVRPGEYMAAPYVVDSRTRHSLGTIVGAVDEPALGLTSDAGFKLFDRVYVTIPKGMQVSVGDSLIVADAEQSVVDVGTVLQPTGVVRIDSIGSGNHASAQLVSQFGPVTTGQVLAPLGRAFEATTVRPVAGDYGRTAKLLWISGSPRLPSVQTYVILAAGQTAGIRMGDQFTLLNSVDYSNGTQVPITATATVTIVRVSATTSTGLIVHQTQPEIYPGMASRLTAKMP
jgi:LysM repeat protein